jgi:hypothetical protein
VKKLIYLILFVGGLYFARPYLEPYLFNALPKEIRRHIFSVDVPPDFRGRYIADLKVDPGWKYQDMNFFSKRMMDTSHKQTIELSAREMKRPVLKRIETDTVEVVAKGPDSILIELTDRMTQKLDYRFIERDDTGIWVTYGEAEKAPRLHFRPQ